MPDKSCFAHPSERYQSDILSIFEGINQAGRLVDTIAENFSLIYPLIRKWIDFHTKCVTQNAEF
jgi:hypothetical protein